jgi:hypothetical protein
MDQSQKNEGSAKGPLSEECAWRKKRLTSDEDERDAAEFNAMVEEGRGCQSYPKDYESDVWPLSGDLDSEADSFTRRADTLPEMAIIIENLYIN